jgi:hypothetical protein
LTASKHRIECKLHSIQSPPPLSPIAPSCITSRALAHQLNTSRRARVQAGLRAVGELYGAIEWIASPGSKNTSPIMIRQAAPMLACAFARRD